MKKRSKIMTRHKADMQARVLLGLILGVKGKFFMAYDSNTINIGQILALSYIGQAKAKKSRQRLVTSLPCLHRPLITPVKKYSRCQLKF